MSYQVLARKWRPKNFQELIGQQHVLKALVNALNQGRLHHAYLFSGTRGVGKTTIARILAKCFNCKQGISDKPCGECEHCKAIDQGSCVDLIEVDAASRTKVEDTRELLDNVQYAPNSARFKIYIIDEVHMLSGHSFNALLKTLEEPPKHVKFLLATTDPQKLPVTVLSRCLQFNLKHLLPEEISTYLQQVLEKEDIAFEDEALNKLARAADGSMRDALSLLDQAIAFCDGEIQTQNVCSMLGAIEQTHIYDILMALSNKDPNALMQITDNFALQSADFATALEDLLSLLHRIAVVQALPSAIEGYPDEKSRLLELTTALNEAEVQLFYQISLIGRSDLPLAPSPKTGFEMILLRMLAFRPVDPNEAPPPAEHSNSKVKKEVQTKPVLQETDRKIEAKPLLPPITEDWNSILPKLQLTGITNLLASNCTIKTIGEKHIDLLLASSQTALLNDIQKKRIQDALNLYYNRQLSLTITVSKEPISTPFSKNQDKIEKSKQEAIKSIEDDKDVKTLLATFEGQVDVNSIEHVAGTAT